jgi:hypothetical protein
MAGFAVGSFSDVDVGLLVAGFVGSITPAPDTGEDSVVGLPFITSTSEGPISFLCVERLAKKAYDVTTIIRIANNPARYFHRMNCGRTCFMQRSS